MFLITGGGSGIGQALAKALAAQDQEVLIVGRRAAALNNTASHSSKISVLVADVSTIEGQTHLVEQLRDYPVLNGLIHNAGIIDPICPLQELNEKAWQQILATNLTAPFQLTQLLFSKLQKGRILHIGSGAAYFPVQGWGGYCVSKAALAMLNRCWQLENPTMAISSVMPGIIDTDMQNQIRQARHMDSDKRDFFLNLHREGKLLTTETVASFLSWLLLKTDAQQYRSQEWDIYDKSHHPFWLSSDQHVPEWQ